MSKMNSVVRVKIAHFSYDPQKVEIETGQSIVWENADAMDHTATRTAAPAFDTGTIHSGSQSNAISFGETTSEQGIEYSCKPHPFMKGWVIVRPASTNEPQDS
jgi:plastocyanin